jgi:hypothetical protein
MGCVTFATMKKCGAHIMVRLLVVMVLGMLAGCTPTESRDPIGQPDDTQKRASRDKTYPYEMSPDEKERFLGSVKALNPGDSYDKVLRLLGPPDDDWEIRGKPPGPLRGTGITYYMKKTKQHIVNEKQDEEVNVIFDKDRQLVELSTNVSGLSPLVGNVRVRVKEVISRKGE